MLTRRQAIQTTALVATATAIVPRMLVRSAPASVTGPFALPPLPYPADALEPHLDARTMEIHHARHHAAYVAGLNQAVAEAPALGGWSVEELLRRILEVPQAVRTRVRNHGGGHCNHSLFWPMMKKNGGGEPRGELARALEQHFGSFANFKAAFTDAALKIFGSGWAWLVWREGSLRIECTPNQDSPLMAASVPLLGVDVWEHAYYLKYQNRRADYLAAWWNVVNWDFVAERHATLRA